jgi:hypothetical protein
MKNKVSLLISAMVRKCLDGIPFEKLIMEYELNDAEQLSVKQLLSEQKVNHV